MELLISDDTVIINYLENQPLHADLQNDSQFCPTAVLYL